MFSYFAASFSDNVKCNKYRRFVALEERLSKYESQFCAVENQVSAGISGQLGDGM